jgi:molybdenum cofactor guanylyltransferase
MRAPGLTVAILAGGEASRLGGRDKGLELLAGRPLIAWSVEFCRTHIAGKTQAEGELALVIVANRHLDEYASHARVLTDMASGFRGPLAGVAAALDDCATPLLLTMPVDCPEPPDDLAARLLAAMNAGNATAVVAHDGERRQPLFALYRRDLSARAAAAAAAGQGVWQWQDAIGAREVDFADRRQQFHNLNTPEEFAAYADALRSRD